jgi:hypothetical protein
MRGVDTLLEKFEHVLQNLPYQLVNLGTGL